MFKVAIVGRSNVGKTTIFNRIIGKKSAIVHNTPGITRDRKAFNVDFFDINLTLTDTAGIDDISEMSDLRKKIDDQSMYAIDEADVCLFVIDGILGVNDHDKFVCNILRRKNKDAILLVNKSENESKVSMDSTLFCMNMTMIFVSAEHNIGFHEVYNSLKPYYSRYCSLIGNTNEFVSKDKNISPISLAVIGKPNVGKSTLINKILGYNRLITDNKAGTTRDAISIHFEYNDIKLKIIDTAGIRKKSNICSVIEKMSVMESFRAIDFASVVILLADVNAPFDDQNIALSSRVIDEGRVLIVAFNKCDTIDSSVREKILNNLKSSITNSMPNICGGDFFTLSALYDKDISPLLSEVVRRNSLWRSKIPTKKLNDWLHNIFTNSHNAPMIGNKKLKMKFISQITTSPPTFAISANFINIAENYISFIRKSIANYFHISGIPIRIVIKKSSNPFLTKKNGSNAKSSMTRRRFNK